MRISDWSSDVCSSDLGNDGQDAEHEADPQVAQQALVAQRAEGGEGLEQVAAVGQQLVRAAGERRGGVLRGEQPLRTAQDTSEERRVGKECVSTCRSWLSQSH